MAAMATDVCASLTLKDFFAGSVNEDITIFPFVKNVRVLLAVTDRVTISADASVMQVTPEVNVTAVLADITDSLTASPATATPSARTVPSAMRPLASVYAGPTSEVANVTAVLWVWWASQLV